jgi:peptidoglycan/xylan/chitin deacetylase (PgdA/CDA1 family)
MDEATERAQIRAAIVSLQHSLGERPLGWYCRYAPSTQTRALLIEEGGFLYDSDSYADDLPYFVTVGGRQHLVVPYSLVTNDAKLAGSAFASDAFFALLRDAFDVLYAEGAERPRMMSVGMHPRILGQPARIAGLARFMDHLRRHDRVWICRRLDIARHWAKTFAAG